MDIKLHIERVVLDNVSLRDGGRHLFQAALERELLQHLATNGELSQTLRAGGTFTGLGAGAVQVGKDNNPSTLGSSVAKAVHSCLTDSEKR